MVVEDFVDVCPGIVNLFAGSVFLQLGKDIDEGLPLEVDLGMPHEATDGFGRVSEIVAVKQLDGPPPEKSALRIWDLGFVFPASGVMGHETHAGDSSTADEAGHELNGALGLAVTEELIFESLFELVDVAVAFFR